MASTSTLKTQSFHEGETISVMSWSSNDDAWMCGDADGYIYSKNSTEDCFKKVEMDANLESVSCLAVNPTKALVAISSEETVEIRSTASFAFLNNNIRRGLPITHVAFEKEGHHMFVSSQEPDLTIFSTSTWQEEAKIATSIGVRTFSVSETEKKLLCMVDVDGNVVIYALDISANLEEGGTRVNTSTLEHSIYCAVNKSITRAPMDDNIGCKVSWHPTNQNGILAIPSMEGSVVVLVKQPASSSSCESWAEHLVVGTSGSSHLNMVQFSSCGKYLLTADAQGTVSVFTFDEARPAASVLVHTYMPSASDNERYLVDIAWDSPSSSVLILAKEWFASAVYSPAAVDVTADDCSSSSSAINTTTAIVLNDEAGEEIEEIVADDACNNDDNDDSNGFGTGTQVATQGGGGVGFQGEMEVAEEGFLDALDAVTAAAALPSNVDMATTAAAAAAAAVNADAIASVAHPVRKHNTFKPSSPSATATSTSSSSSAKAPTPAKSTTVVAVGGKGKLTKSSARLLQDDDDDDEISFDVASPPAVAAAAKASKVPTPAAAAAAAASAAVVGDIDVTDIGKLKAAAAIQSVELASEDVVDDEEEEEEDYENDNTTAGMTAYGGPLLHGHHLLSSSSSSSAAAAALAATTIQLQPPMQPSTTTVDEKRRRYLVWNNIGNITHREDDAESRIEIRFTNTQGGNRNEAFPDRNGFTMGALCHEGAAFATSVKAMSLLQVNSMYLASLDNDKKLETPEGSIVYYHAFAGQKHMQGVNATFLVTLSPGENAQSIAAGKGFVAVATSRNLLRIYSSTGMPVDVICLRGPVVSLIAHESKLAVITHSAPDVQNMSFRMEAVLFDVNWQVGCQLRVECDSCPLPLSPGSSLAWAGFDADMHTLTVLDSHGMMCNLSRVSMNSWRWQPVLDINEAKSSPEHVYWPVMIKQGKLVYVLLNGENKPAVYPQPVVSVTPLRVPLVLENESNTISGKKNKQVMEQKGKLQHLMLDSSRSAHLEAMQAEFDAMKAANVTDLPEEYSEELAIKLQEHQEAVDLQLLKQLQDACVQGDIPRALNVCLSIKCIDSLPKAITVANHFGRQAVAMALQSILDFKQEQEELKLQQQQQQQIVSSNVSFDHYQSPSQQQYYQAEEEEEQEQARHHHQQQQQQSPPVPTARSSGSVGLVSRRKRSASNGGIADEDDDDQDDHIFDEDNRHAATATSHVESSRGSKFNAFFAAKPAAGGSHISSSSTVSPPAAIGGVAGASPNKPLVVNPFAVKSTGNTPIKKRKSTYAGMQDLKASPSPAKKHPTLSRTSTFAQEARHSKHSSMKLL